MEIITYFLYFSEKNKLNENKKINYKRIKSHIISQKKTYYKNKVKMYKNDFQRSDLEQSLNQIKRLKIKNVISFIWDALKFEKIDKINYQFLTQNYLACFCQIILRT